MNEKLGIAHGNGCFDIRSYLVANGLSDAGITPTEQDEIDIAADIGPSSIRAPQSTRGHLNAAGQKVAADQRVAHMS